MVTIQLLSLSDGQLTALDVVDGGDGVDTVVSAENAIVASVLGGLSNVEKLSQTINNVN